jgi:cell division protein FtsB
MVSKIEQAGSDEFIANEARTKYGFLADGEIRFIITNPSVLWGEEGPPPGWKNPNER